MASLMPSVQVMHAWMTGGQAGGRVVHLCDDYCCKRSSSNAGEAGSHACTAYPEGASGVSVVPLKSLLANVTLPPVPWVVEEHLRQL
jgi:hypothetical protein